MTFMRMITHQKHLAQSGRSTRSAVDIFNALCLFNKDPIRGQEIKLECVNVTTTHTSQGPHSDNDLIAPTEDT